MNEDQSEYEHVSPIDLNEKLGFFGLVKSNDSLDLNLYTRNNAINNMSSIPSFVQSQLSVEPIIALGNSDAFDLIDSQKKPFENKSIALPTNTFVNFTNRSPALIPSEFLLDSKSIDPTKSLFMPISSSGNDFQNFYSSEPSISHNNELSNSNFPPLKDSITNDNLHKLEHSSHPEKKWESSKLNASDDQSNLNDNLDNYLEGISNQFSDKTLYKNHYDELEHIKHINPVNIEIPEFVHQSEVNFSESHTINTQRSDVSVAPNLNNFDEFMNGFLEIKKTTPNNILSNSIPVLKNNSEIHFTLVNNQQHFDPKDETEKLHALLTEKDVSIIVDQPSNTLYHSSMPKKHYGVLSDMAEIPTSVQNVLNVPFSSIHANLGDGLKQPQTPAQLNFDITSFDQSGTTYDLLEDEFELTSINDSTKSSNGNNNNDISSQDNSQSLSVLVPIQSEGVHQSPFQRYPIDNSLTPNDTTKPKINESVMHDVVKHTQITANEENFNSDFKMRNELQSNIDTEFETQSVTEGIFIPISNNDHIDDDDDDIQSKDAIQPLALTPSFVQKVSHPHVDKNVINEFPVSHSLENNDFKEVSLVSQRSYPGVTLERLHNEHFNSYISHQKTLGYVAFLLSILGIICFIFMVKWIFYRSVRQPKADINGELNLFSTSSVCWPSKNVSITRKIRDFIRDPLAMFSRRKRFTTGYGVITFNPQSLQQSNEPVQPDPDLSSQLESRKLLGNLNFTSSELKMPAIHSIPPTASKRELVDGENLAALESPTSKEDDPQFPVSQPFKRQPQSICSQSQTTSCLPSQSSFFTPSVKQSNVPYHGVPTVFPPFVMKDVAMKSMPQAITLQRNESINSVTNFASSYKSVSCAPSRSAEVQTASLTSPSAQMDFNISSI